MSLTKKASIITLIIICVLIPILYFTTKSFFFDNVILMEKNQLEQDMKITNELINKRIDLMDSVNNNWAICEDTYNFMNKINEKYIEDNLSYLSFKAINVDCMLFFNKNMEFTYGMAYNIETGERIKINDNLIKGIKGNEKIIKIKNVKDSVKGIIVYDDIPYIMAARQISKNNYLGESNGLLVTLKNVSQNDILDIQNTIKMPLKMETYKSKRNSSNFSLACKEIEKNTKKSFIMPLNNDLTQIYFVGSDLQGKNAVVFMLEMQKDKELYSIAYKKQMVFLAVLISVIMLFAITALIVLNYFVFTPMNRLNIILNTIPAAVYMKNKEKRYIFANKIFYEFFNIRNDIKAKLTDKDIITWEAADKQEAVDSEIMANKVCRINMVSSFKTLEGKLKWFSTSKSPMIDHKGKVIGVVGVTTDITNIKEMEEKLEYVTIYDELTGLVKRNALLKQLKQSLQEAENTDNKVSVLSISIDEHRIISDSQGHEVGEELLKEASRRICDIVDQNGITAKTGDNEITAMFSNITPGSVFNFKDRIQKALTAPWYHNSATYSISNSIGIALYPDDAINAEELLKNAGTAMQGAKETGKNRYMFYNKNLTQKIFEKIETEKNIRYALERDEFLLYYQPQISLDGKKILGAEALIRWIHPVLGFIPPYKFISIAEDSNLIVPIGEWVLKTACKQAKIWSAKLNTPVKVSVNISSVQLYQSERDIIKVILELLHKTNLPPHLLEVEITESVVMKDFDISCKILKELKNNGITIALDDFGTGYSSMVYLKNLPIDKIKIDQNFVRDLKEGSNDQVIVKTIVQLSKELGLSVIAEGVETREQLEILKRCNCQELQGYLFNKPVSAKDFEEYYNSWDSIKNSYFEEFSGKI